MARHQKRHRIVCDRVRNGTNRSRTANTFGDLTIRLGLPGTDRQQCLPDLQLECRASKIEPRQLAGRVGQYLQDQLSKSVAGRYSGRRRLQCLNHAAPVARFEFELTDPAPGRHDQTFAKWRRTEIVFQMLDIHCDILRRVNCARKLWLHTRLRWVMLATTCP